MLYAVTKALLSGAIIAMASETSQIAPPPPTATFLQLSEPAADWVEQHEH